MTTLAEQKRLVLWTIGMTALAVMLLWAAFLVRGVLLLIYVSILLAVGFSPIVRLIERQRLLPIGPRRFPRWLAILVLYLFIIGTIIGIGFLVFPPLIRQARDLWDALPAMFERAQQWLIAKGLLGEHLTWRQAVEKADVSGGERAVGTVVAAVTGVAGGLFGLFTILVLTFYFLVEAGRLRESLLQFFARRNRARVDAAIRDITLKVSAWLGGQLLLGLTIGASSAIALWLLDIPFFYVLALISGIGEMIPVVGPILAAIPAVAVAATRLIQQGAAGDCLLRRSAAVRESRPGPEAHGAAGWGQRRHRHRRAPHRRHPPRHPRCDPRGADGSHPPGAVQRMDALARGRASRDPGPFRHANRVTRPASLPSFLLQPSSLARRLRASLGRFPYTGQMRIDPLGLPRGRN